MPPRSNNNKNNNNRGGRGPANQSEEHREGLAVKYLDAMTANNELKAKNAELTAENKQLKVDKAELAKQVETEKKRNGDIISKGAEQLKLTESMVCSVKNLVQHKLFLTFPLLDKTMYHQSNLIAPIATNLGIAKKDWPKYSVDIRRVCIDKTRYWREYCGNQVKTEYISKCSVGRSVGQSVRNDKEVKPLIPHSNHSALRALLQNA